MRCGVGCLWSIGLDTQAGIGIGIGVGIGMGIGITTGHRGPTMPHPLDFACRCKEKEYIVGGLDGLAGL